MKITKKERIYDIVDIKFDRHDVELFESLGIYLELVVDGQGYEHFVRFDDENIKETRKYNFIKKDIYKKTNYDKLHDFMLIVLFGISLLLLLFGVIVAFVHLFTC